MCPTDSRLRSDQRAFEYGDVSLGEKEKLRLEEAQRARRKARKEKNEEWEPTWFSKRVHLQTGDTIYELKDNYWDRKKLNDWEEVPDIFN